MECNQCNSNENIEEMEKESKIELILYVLSIVILLLSFIPICITMKPILILISTLLAGYEILFTGIKNIFKLNFEEDTLMTIAVIAAFLLGEYVESALIVILYKLGEFLEEKAENKSEQSIEEIVKIKAETANLIKENKEIEVIDVENVKVNDVVLIKPGEKIPVDAIIISGVSEVDTSNITGESTPLYVKENDEILSGGINLSRSTNL